MPSLTTQKNLWQTARQGQQLAKQTQQHELDSHFVPRSLSVESDAELQFAETPNAASDGSSPRQDILELQKTWPIAAQLFKRRSCEMMTTMGPCIQKAVTHLEMVQDLIEQWFLSGERMVHSAISQPSECDMEETFIREITPASSTHEMLYVPVSPRLLISIDGRPIAPGSYRPQSSQPPGGDESDTVLANIGAEQVIDEVVKLLARLEKDRQDTEYAYVNECGVVHMLNDQLAEKARIRLVDLPLRVQREHEACIMDMSELQWHVNYSIRMKDRIESKASTAEMFNKRLKEDIDFVQEHVPLIQEKLDLELTSMNKIREAQLETNKELEETLFRLAKTESKSSEAHKKAEKERAHIAAEIQGIRDKLKERQEELGECNELTEKYEKDTEKLQTTIADLKKQHSKLELDIDEIREKEEKLSRKVSKLELVIADVNFEQNRHININLGLKNDLARKRKKNLTEVNGLQKTMDNMQNEAKRLLYNNKDMTMRIDDVAVSIKKCASQTEQNEKEFTRIEREAKRCDTQMKEMKKLYDANLAMFERKQEAFEQEKAKRMKIEEALKHTAETLKRHVRDEAHTRAILQARIGTDGMELTKSRNETDQKTTKASKMVEEVESALVTVRSKVLRMRNFKEVYDTEIDDLGSNVELVTNKMAEMTVEHDRTISEKEPQLDKLHEDFIQSDKELKIMMLKMSKMAKHQTEMEESSEMMKKVAYNTEKQNRALERERAEYAIQLAAAKKTYADLEELSAQLKARMIDAARKHRELMKARRNYFTQESMEKNNKLLENAKLASDYRKEQNNYYIMKNNLLNIFEDRVRLEKSIQSLKQLLSLQKRMHLALLSYFKYRGLYHSSKFSKLEYMANCNNNDMAQLKKQIDAALKNLSHFLTSEIKDPPGLRLPELKSTSKLITDTFTNDIRIATS